MARITSKGQVTIPRAVREDLGLHAGDELDFVKENGGYRVRRRTDPGVFDRYRGILKLGKTTDEIIEEMRGPADLD
jgi:AbrB family looped-hinge helix DNA binding protein